MSQDNAPDHTDRRVGTRLSKGTFAASTPAVGSTRSHPPEYLYIAVLPRECSLMPRLVFLRSVAGLGSSRVGGYGGRQQPVEAVQVCCRI